MCTSPARAAALRFTLLLLALLLCGVRVEVAWAAPRIALNLPGGPLWSGLQYLARHSGQRILVPGGSAALQGLRHPSLAQQMTLEAALDHLLLGSGYTWRRDPHGSILIVTARRSEAQLDRLRISADEPLENPGSPGSWSSATMLPDIGVGALEGIRLAAVPADRFSDILRRAPNVSGQGEGLAIRGIERGSAAVATSNVYLDGIPVSAHQLESMALPPLHRIDYLRGPRALRDGPGGLAGVIRLQSADPLPQPNFYGRLAVAERNTIDLRGGGGGQIGAAGPVLGINAVMQREGGRIDAPISGDRGLDRNRQSLLHGRLLFEPDTLEALTLRASWLLQRADPGLPTLLPPEAASFSLAQPRPQKLAPPEAASFDPFAWQSFDTAPRARDLEAGGGAFDLEWRATPTSALRLFALASDVRFASASRRPAADGGRQIRQEDEGAREFGLRWQQDFGAGWHGSLGFDRSERDTRLAETRLLPLQAFFPASLVIEVTPDTERRITAEVRNRFSTRGIFAQLEWLGERAGVGIGLRRFDEDHAVARLLESVLTEDGCMLRIGNGPLHPCEEDFPTLFSPQRTPSEDSVWVPNLRATWQPHPQHGFALELRRGFVSGGARLDPSSEVVVPYDPERSDTLDLSWSARWLEGRLRLDAELFYNHWYDRQVPLDLAQRESYVILNAGKAHAYGGEVELHWEANERLRLWLGVGMLRTRYDEFNALLPGGDEVDLAGRQFPGAPGFTATAGLWWHFATRWQLGLSQWYSGEAFSDALNSPVGRRSGYALLDLSLRRELGERLQWELFIRNALDRAYLENLHVEGRPPRPREYLPGRERRVGVALEWRW